MLLGHVLFDELSQFVLCGIRVLLGLCQDVEDFGTAANLVGSHLPFCLGPLPSLNPSYKLVQFGTDVLFKRALLPLDEAFLQILV